MFNILFHTAYFRTPGVPQAMIDTEVWVPFDREEPVTSQTMADAGSLGITGRWVFMKHPSNFTSTFTWYT